MFSTWPFCAGPGPCATQALTTLSRQRSSTTSIAPGSIDVTPLRRCRRFLPVAKANLSERRNKEFVVICETLSHSDSVVRKRKDRHVCTITRQQFAQQPHRHATYGTLNPIENQHGLHDCRKIFERMPSIPGFLRCRAFVRALQIAMMRTNSERRTSGLPVFHRSLYGP